jgi:hypothetical protein
VAHSRWSRDLVYAGFTPQDQEWKSLVKNIDNGLFQSSEVQQWVRTLLIINRDERVSRGESADLVAVHAEDVTGVLTADLVSGPTSRKFILTVNFVRPQTPGN